MKVTGIIWGDSTYDLVFELQYKFHMILGQVKVEGETCLTIQV